MATERERYRTEQRARGEGVDDMAVPSSTMRRPSMAAFGARKRHSEGTEAVQAVHGRDRRLRERQGSNSGEEERMEGSG